MRANISPLFEGVAESAETTRDNCVILEKKERKRMKGWRMKREESMSLFMRMLLKRKGEKTLFSSSLSGTALCEVVESKRLFALS